MRVLLTGLIATVLIPASAWAGDFTIEDAALKPLPKAVEQALRQDESFADYSECRPIGQALDIGSPAYVVTTADGCNWGAALGPIWVVTTQPQPAVVLSGGGYALRVRPDEQNGLKSVEISAGTAGWTMDDVWKFDGRRYVKADKPKKSKASKRKR